MKKLLQFFAVVALLTSCVARVAVAQNGAIAPPLVRPFWNPNSGALVPLGFVCTTGSGGSTPLATYQNLAASTPNQNPIRLNAFGEPVNGSTIVPIYLSDSTYRFTLYAAGSGNTCNGTTVGTLLWQQDGVTANAAGGAVSGTGTANTIPIWTNSTTIGNSSISAVNLGGPGLGVLINDKVLIGASTATSTDAISGALFVNGSVSIENNTANAHVVRISANSGGATILAGVTGSATVESLILGTDDGIGGLNYGITITPDPIIQLTTSYSGANKSASGTVALRNDAGVFEISQNAGGWNPVINGSGFSGSMARWTGVGTISSSNLQENFGAGTLTIADFTSISVSTSGLPFKAASTYNLQSEIARFVSADTTSNVTTYISTSTPAGSIFNSALVMTMQATNLSHTPTLNLEGNAACGLVGSCFEFNSNGVSFFADEDGASSTETNIVVSFNGDTRRVLVGAADSGGTGFRMLRIAN